MGPRAGDAERAIERAGTSHVARHDDRGEPEGGRVTSTIFKISMAVRSGESIDLIWSGRSNGIGQAK